MKVHIPILYRRMAGVRFGWNNEGLSSLAVMMREEGGIFGKGRGILSFLNPDSMGLRVVGHLDGICRLPLPGRIPLFSRQV